MSLLKVYTSILNNCKSKMVIEYTIKRIHKILSKEFKKRDATDFPQTSFDLQVVHLISYLKEEKLPYAFLYSSSLCHIIAQNSTKNGLKEVGGTLTLWNKLKCLFWRI